MGDEAILAAIVDQFRTLKGSRPSVDPVQPSLRINVYLLKDSATVSIDLSGDSLHRRGYRDPHAPAPLKAIKLRFPSRYAHRFPAPDDEPFDGVHQLEFGLQFFALVFALFIAVASLAAFVLVPTIGLIFTH